MEMCMGTNLRVPLRIKIVILQEIIGHPKPFEQELIAPIDRKHDINRDIGDIHAQRIQRIIAEH